MFRLSHLLLLCTWLTVRVSAYDIPGAYERVFFYYAYLMEIELYGEAKTIAPACGRIMGTGGKPCSYDQWVDYAKKGATDKVNYVRITGEGYVKGVYPDVHKVAQLTYEKDQTGPLELGRVVAGFETDLNSNLNSYAQVLQKTADRVKLMSYDPKLLSALRDGGLDAMRSVIFKRIDASMTSFKEKEAGRGRTVTLVDRPLHPEHGDWGTVKEVDRDAYVKDNPGSSTKDLVKRLKGDVDASHTNNVKALKPSWEEMKLGC